MRTESSEQYQRNVDALAYFFTGGPLYTDEALAKAKEIMARPLASAKRNLVREMGIVSPATERQQDRERGR